MIPVLITLIHNAALLLAMMVVFDLVTSRKSVYSQWWRQALAGVILGALCIGLMIASFQLESGIIFDTRSVLLSLSGLFLGLIPTLFAMVIATVYRLWQGGVGALTGIMVILATGGIGLLWRHYRQGQLENISVRELYGFGVVVHLVMLALMLILPWETAQRVLASIGLPVLLVYPIATIALGWLLASRLQRENATAVLMRSEQRFRQLFEVAPVPLVFTDREGTLTLVNDRWEQAFGYTRKEIPTIKNWWRLVYPDPEYRRLVIDSWEAAVRHARETDKDTVELQDYRITCKNGDVRTIEITGAFIEEQLLVAFYDITERKQAEHRLKQQKNQLEQRNRALRQFNYAVSHELKTPLVSIESSLGLIQSSLPQTTDPELTTAFGYARTATRQMNNLLESLLLMFRIDTADSDTEATAFRVLVEDAIGQLTWQNKLEGIRVTIAEDGLELCGDRHKLVQIWLQLIGNAAKYMGDQMSPAIGIGAEQIDQEIQFFVRDNGKGIEKTYQDKIFGLFDRLDKTADGTGLGLTLVQRIVDYYGGTIRVESEGLGKGSCFYFTLPDVLINKDTTT